MIVATFLLFIVAACVNVIVAALGIGGGSLMVPFLVLLVGFASLHVFGHWFILFPHGRSGFILHCGGVHRQPLGNGTSRCKAETSKKINITQQGETYKIMLLYKTCNGFGEC